MRSYKTIAFLSAAVVIIMMSAVMIHAQKFASPVNDEPANIPSGYAFVLTGKYEDPTHPPLARYLFAIPLFFLSADPMGGHDYIERDWHRYGRDFIFRNSAPAGDIVFWTRFVNILLTCILAAVLFFWSRKFWGNIGAVVSLLFFAFEPTVLGHGSLATTDMAISLIFFLASFLYMRYRKRPSAGNFALFALAACAAPLVKFSGVIVFASVFITSIFAKGSAGEKPQLSFFKRAAIMVVLFLSLVSVAYRFEHRSISEDPQIASTRESAKIREAISRFAAAAGISEEAVINAKIPLYSFLKGFGSQIFHSMSQDQWEDKDFYQYLMGAYSRNGWWYYFPAAFALKSTLPFIIALLILLATGLFACARGFKNCTKNPLFVYAFIPFAVYLFFLLTTTINIGIRYILPLYPFLALFLGWFGKSADENPASKTPSPKKTNFADMARTVTAATCLTAHLFLSISVYPFYMSYFNEFAGGSKNGWKYLADSNIDWGQDIYFLAEDIEKQRKDNKDRAFYGNIFGTIRPEDIGVMLRPIPEKGLNCGGKQATLYMSVNKYLLKSALHPDGLYPWLTAVPFDRIVGSSIFAWDNFCRLKP